MKIEFWFEFASTYSYPAAMRIEDLVQSHGLELVWRPFLLGPLFKQQGWHDSPFNVYPVKGEYMWKDMERECHDLGLSFSRPSVFPRNGLLAARIATLFDAESWTGEFIRSVYLANFRDDLDISCETILAELLPNAAGNPEQVMEATQHSDNKALLRKRTEEAVKKGIFGAPSFYVNGELFWGNDRLEKALRFASQSKASDSGV